jgi:hypothetical protein
MASDSIEGIVVVVAANLTLSIKEQDDNQTADT